MMTSKTAGIPMPPEDLERKLAAILSADVAGYSRLMGDDEEATIRTLTDYRRAMADLTQQYRGRVVDSPGDNLLAEFASVQDAVNCAVEIQRELAERNAELLEDRRMEFRIGLNLGDVVTEGERIYGDGVNIAARMEGLAEGGGICLSGTVYDAIGKKIGLEYEYLGEQEVKNISKPVRAYRVLMHPEAVGSGPAEKKAKSRVWRKVAIALGVIVVLLLGAAGVLWNVYFRLPDVKGVPDVMKDFTLPDGPSIAVLPFVNMSGDPEQEYFSDGLTENIISGLSSDGRLLVIARNSTFSYKGKSVKVQEVARELGAKYVVEGSVQKTQDRVRITVQLIDANTGHHVWSDRYDRDLNDIFALQDEITMRIMRAVGMKLVAGEQYGEKLPPSGNLEVYMKLLKAAEYFWRVNREGNILARQELEEAIALDPEYSRPYSLLAWTHFLDLFFGSSESHLISFAQANKNIKKALELDNENWIAHLALSELYLLRHEHEKAIAAVEDAIALNPNGADAYSQLGFVLVMSGKAEEGIKLIEKSIRLNPIPPAHYLNRLGYAYRFLGRYEDAIEVHKEVLKRSPDNLFAHMWLTADYSTLGREEEARHQAEEVMRLDPTFSLERYVTIHSMKDKAEFERYIADLRNAGLK
jgi:adenylate cyclase